MERISCNGLVGETMLIPGIVVLLAQSNVNGGRSVAEDGIGLGSVIAVVCSWHRNRSILWAILAGIFSWFYVIYFAMTRRADERK
jgi:hypothetical protein